MEATLVFVDFVRKVRLTLLKFWGIVMALMRQPPVLKNVTFFALTAVVAPKLGDAFFSLSSI